VANAKCSEFIASFRVAVLTGILLAGGHDALAHGDTDKPLFVSADGTDSGPCTDRLSPCRSISYALTRAGKGAKIKVAAGSYPIDNPEDLFHLVSAVMDVTGGYKPSENFAVPHSGVTFLTGVPVEFRAMLSEKGFQVIADRKGIDGPKAAKALALLGLHDQLQSSLGATPCSNGNAGGLACERMDLLAHLAFRDISSSPGAANDVWGFVDLNSNREYVIAGYNVGIAVIDVTDPESPREVGFIDGQNATWRDIKVYQYFDAASDRWRAVAYVTTDGATDGLFVIDLSGLPHSIRRVNYSSDFFSAHNVYAAAVDFSTGIPLSGTSPSLVIAGSNISGGQYRSYSLGNPVAPNFVGGAASSADYMHDAASIVITDNRKDTQCVNSGAFCEVLFDFNENTLDVWDITVASNPQRLSRTPYTNSGYTHSGWPTEDGRFVFLHDELDEQRFNLNTMVRVFSLASLATPIQVGSWSGSTKAIDHNGFVRGNRYYLSNYSRGLTVLDISNPTVPVEIGRMDTYPFSDSSSFVGAWGTYPYLHSRVVAVSDIDSGLYLVADRTLDVPQGSLQFARPSFGVTEGGSASLLVERVGGSAGNVSVDFQLIPATATSDDFMATSGTLSWGATDTADKTIDIVAISDGVNEGLERVLVRLISPTGGATLGAIATASLYIGDAGAAAEIALAEPTIDVTERGFGTAVVVLRRNGSAAGPVSVDYAMTGGDANNPGDFLGVTSDTVSWEDGDGDPKWIEFPIVNDGASESTEYVELTLDNASGATLTGLPTVRINIEDGNGVNQAPNAVAGASQSVTAGSQVVLDGSASNDQNGDTLSFEWSQTGGPMVTLSNADSATAQFTAPSVQSDTLLQFRLTVRDPGGLSDSATTTVIALSGNAGGGAGGSSGGGLVGLPMLLLLAMVLLTTRRRGAVELSSVRDPVRSR
jgi:choice-of-anchor B domain-containing protein